jgi:alkylation response protein AidB-like acyl-CoA dehydrogenase
MPDSIITDTATKIFADLCEAKTINAAEKGEWPTELWDALEESGLPLTWVSDEFGGAGAELLDGFAVLRVAGNHAAPVPLAETLLAGWLLGEAGIEAPAGPMTIAPVHEDGILALSGGKLSGRARKVPFASASKHFAVLAKDGGGMAVALVAADAVTINAGRNIAGEPSDEVSFDGAAPIAVKPATVDLPALIRLGAAVRAQQMAGALAHVLDASVQFALDRVQFGRPIAKFQAVQHNLAQLADEAAAAGAAADAAAEAIATYGIAAERAVAECAIAKLRVGEAASTGAAIAHQVHGAMGFTYEHTLHHSTRRLWSWREEFGNETYWALRIGRMVADRGADDLWPFLTAGS